MVDEIAIVQDRVLTLEKEVRRLRAWLNDMATPQGLRATGIVGVIPPESGGTGVDGSILGAVTMWENNSGGLRTQGHVVIWDGDQLFDVSNVQDDTDVIGVLDEFTAVGEFGRVRHVGYQSHVGVTGAVVVGNYLRQSAVFGLAEDAGASPTAGSFAIALTAAAGPGIGTVAAYLFPVSYGKHNTLDEAYDEGGAGAGRVVTVDSGAIRLNGPAATTEVLWAMLAADVQPRITIRPDSIRFGAGGAAAVDVTLERTAANRLGLAVGDAFETDTIGERGVGTRTTVEDGLILPHFLNLPATLLTIAAGVITPTRSHHRVDTELAAATDNLDTINAANAIDGDVLIIRPEDAARTVVIRHGIGNILCVNNGNISLDDAHDFAILVYVLALTAWICLSDTQGGAGGNTLDQAYDQGGAGAGRTITVDSGAVRLDGPLVTTEVFHAMLAADAQPRVAIRPDSIRLGPGGAVAPDVALDRSAANRLRVSGDQHLTGHLGVAVAPAATTFARVQPSGAWAAVKGIDLTTVGLSLTGNGAQFQSILGIANANIQAATVGDMIDGLNFIAAIIGGGVGTTVARLAGIWVRCGTFGFTTNLTLMAGMFIESPSIFAVGALTIAEAVSIQINDPGGAASRVTDAYGIRMGEITAGPTGVRRLLELGKNPELRLDSGDPAANLSQLWLAVNNGAVVLRQVEIGAANSGGAGFRMLRVLN